jgi:predicted phage terminase large subunit-like protein
MQNSTTLSGLAARLPSLTAIQAERLRRKAEAERRDVERHADEIRERCRKFVGFVREAWHVVEPTKPYVYGWHHSAIGEHYEAVVRGEIHHLAVNQPPNTSKSTLLSVLAGAYEWGPCERPGIKFLTTSYKEGYARRDSRSMRDLVMSEWFQALWPGIVITRDNEVDFENSAHGGRKAVAFASLTSGHGDRVIIDDPHSTETVESEIERSNAVRIFRESVPSRGINPATDATKDVCGAIEEFGMNYVRLILPMEYDPKIIVPSRYFTDPRTQPGELLWPERFGRAFIDSLKTGGHLTSHAYATQYQQQTSAREGGMFKRHWFKIVDAVPAEASVRVRRWDLAASENSGDWTVGVRMTQVGGATVNLSGAASAYGNLQPTQPKGGMTVGGRFYVEDVIRFREVGSRVRTAIRAAASQDGQGCHIVVPQDPGQAGKEQAASIIAENAGYVITADRESGSKTTRAEPFAAQCEAGNVYLVRAPWNEAFIDELCSFPQQGADDQVDAAAGAFNKLATFAAPAEYTPELFNMLRQYGAQRQARRHRGR